MSRHPRQRLISWASRARHSSLRPAPNFHLEVSTGVPSSVTTRAAALVTHRNTPCYRGHAMLHPVHLSLTPFCDRHVQKQSTAPPPASLPGSVSLPTAVRQISATNQ